MAGTGWFSSDDATAPRYTSRGPSSWADSRTHACTLCGRTPTTVLTLDVSHADDDETPILLMVHVCRQLHADETSWSRHEWEVALGRGEIA